MKPMTLVIGGTQGEGIVSTGAILSKVLSRNGYYTYTHRTFASRIKGGHTRSRIDITPFRNAAPFGAIHLVLAFDEETARLEIGSPGEGCLILTDDALTLPDPLPPSPCRVLALPLTETALQAGAALMKNTVALGILCGLLGLDPPAFKDVLREKYAKKGPSVVDDNLKAFDRGLALAQTPLLAEHPHLRLDPADGRPRPVMTGNYALALGALAGGCRFISAYPITPASEIMEYLSAKLPGLGGLMVQTEDEIAAVTMAIGAAYGGARSMTSTSGPGLSLMGEGIGLAAMGELPLVLVDSQRAGPSTGLPTKMEQSDFAAAVFGGHGEFPRVVLAPHSVESCFETAREAFDLAENLACPVLILSDLALGLFPQTVDFPLLPEPAVPTSEKPDPLFKKDGGFLRYAPGNRYRPLPGEEGGLHYVTGLEHGPLGAPNNKPENRVAMMKRRMKKLDALEGVPGIVLEGGESPLLVLAAGSVHGAALRAFRELADPPVLGALHRIHPFPVRELETLARRFERILVVETNFTGQLHALARQALPPALSGKLHTLRKSSGEPLTPEEILKKAKELI